MYFTVTSTISSFRGRVAGIGPISNYPVITNSISWKSQQYITFTLVMGGIVSGMRPISTSSFNTNPFPLIAKGRLAGILLPVSTFINIFSVITRGRLAGQTWPTSKTSAITWGRVSGILIPMYTTFTTSTINWGKFAGLKRPISMTFLYQMKFHTFFLRNFLTAITTTVGRIYGLKIPRSYISTSLHC